MLEIPGYVYDETTNRYYKDSSNRKKAPPNANEKLQKLKLEAAAKRSDDDQARTASRKKTVTPKKFKKPLLALDANSPAVRFHDAVATSRLPAAPINRLRHETLLSSLRHLSPIHTEDPELPIGDTITRFAFDEAHPDVVRYGSAQGHLGSGRISQGARPLGHSVSEWRVEHVFGSPVTSLNVAGERLLATCFGTPAQALVANTSAEHPATMTLAPRKTSLWSSSLLGNHVALGCDKKILYSSDLSRAEMTSLNTGSAVFAIEQQEQELLAGTRSGHVRAYDLRVAHDEQRSSRSEILLRLPTSVTHLRRLSNYLLLTVLMDGSISTFDRRYLPTRPEPVQQLAGHVNTTSVYLGCDVWQDSVLALAGEDKKVRIWSLKTGRLLHAIIGNGKTLLSTRFEDRVQAIEFRQSGSEVGLWLADGCSLSRYILDTGDNEV